MMTKIRALHWVTAFMTKANDQEFQGLEITSTEPAYTVLSFVCLF